MSKIYMEHITNVHKTCMVHTNLFVTNYTNESIWERRPSEIDPLPKDRVEVHTIVTFRTWRTKIFTLNTQRAIFRHIQLEMGFATTKKVMTTQFLRGKVDDYLAMWRKSSERSGFTVIREK